MRLTRRSRAREVALQLLFQRDQNKIEVPRKAVQKFCWDRLTDPDLVKFSLTLFDGSLTHRADVDKLLAQTAENWRLSRMMPVDRNVLRLGAFELLHDPDQAPVPVVINEAIELARRYGTADSPAFVNGILDRIAQQRKGEGGRGNAELKPEEPPAPAVPPTS